METSLSPREIQARIRGGASIEEVADESGSTVERISVFALPVIAEREHVARTALSATVRRRGDGSGHRRLREIISDRLRARSLDPDTVEWDAWREADLRWRVVGTLEDEVGPRVAEFRFDPKARFSVADNADARWMIGEEVTGSGDPDNENTIDFDDELALVRATQDTGTPAAIPGDEVPISDDYADAHTSELDDLYDMLSGVSEDSVRIYVGLEDESGEQTQGTGAAEDEFDVGVDELVADLLTEDEELPADERSPGLVPESEDSAAQPQQDTLIDEPETESKPKKSSRRRRAQIPSWDEIMFGGRPSP